MFFSSGDLSESKSLLLQNVPAHKTFKFKVEFWSTIESAPKHAHGFKFEDTHYFGLPMSTKSLQQAMAKELEVFFDKATMKLDQFSLHLRFEGDFDAAEHYETAPKCYGFTIFTIN